MLAFAVLDVRELFHQADIDESALAVLAGAAAEARASASSAKGALFVPSERLRHPSGDARIQAEGGARRCNGGGGVSRLDGATGHDGRTTSFGCPSRQPSKPRRPEIRRTSSGRGAADRILD